MKKLLWKLNRLRAMTLREVLYWVGPALQKRLGPHGIDMTIAPCRQPILIEFMAN